MRHVFGVLLVDYLNQEGGGLVACLQDPTLLDIGLLPLQFEFKILVGQAQSDALQGPHFNLDLCANWDADGLPGPNFYLLDYVQGDGAAQTVALVDGRALDR